MNNHHAVLLLGSNLAEAGLDLVLIRMETEVDYIDTEVLSIGEVRKIITLAYGRPLEKPTKTILIKANTIAVEAQNALLKILEEPPLTTKFILLLRGKAGLLPTLLSRLSETTDRENIDTNDTTYFEDFLKLDIGNKISQIAEIAKTKDGEGYELLYLGLINWLIKNTDNKNRAQINWCLNQLTMRGASKKMLWEEIALSM
jgi:DNA polymerase III delta prime subunit